MSETETETPEPEITEPDEETTEEEEAEEAQPSESQLQAEQAAADAEAFKEEWQRASAAYKKRLAKLTGQNMDDFACPTCNGDGYIESPPVEEIPLRPKLDAQTCPTCDGYGQLLAPTKVEGHMFPTCNQCAGAGWIAAQAQTNVVDLPTAQVPAPAQPQVGEFLPGIGFKPFGSDEVIPFNTQAG